MVEDGGFKRDGMARGIPSRLPFPVQKEEKNVRENMNSGYMETEREKSPSPLSAVSSWMMSRQDGARSPLHTFFMTAILGSISLHVAREGKCVE